MKKIINALCLFYCLLFTKQLGGQISKIDITVHARVDTSIKEVREIVALWKNYLNATPDSIYDNPYWNATEKLKFKDFDFSRNFLYQFPSKQLLSHFKPTILSVEKEGGLYVIRTIFFAEGIKGEYRKSNPWCITRLYAVKENGLWKLKNALPVITENWNRKTIGKITFIYPAQHHFNEVLAQKAILFCNEISTEFEFPDWEPFDFYLTKSGDEMGRLLNFDFFFAGYTTGVAFKDNRILLSGFGSEYYPHEFLHLIVPKFERHSLIEEGFATWKGGQGQKTFEESAAILAKELAKNDTVTFSDVLNKKWGYGIAAFYTSGAILCNAAYKKGGVNKVRLLLNIGNNHEELVQNISNLFEIKEEDFDKFWRAEVLKYAPKKSNE